MNYAKKFLFVLFFLSLSTTSFSQKNLVFSKATFKTGDDTLWKNLSFDDSKWDTIGTTLRWEEQGYKKYDGYAWYRFKFILPSSLKDKAYLKDTLSLLLSKIDDVDESFLNGVKIGQTGSLPSDPGGVQGKWDTFRVYNIPSNSSFIHWDKENVIAVRVYDRSNGGGIFGPMPSVKMKEPQDAVKLKLDAVPITSKKYRASITNTSRRLIEGTWTILVKDGNANKNLKSIVKRVKIAPFKTLFDSITISKSTRLEVICSFKELHTGEVQSVVRITPYILTPLPSAIPKINSAAVFGVRPGSPLLFKVSATGKDKLHYQAYGLPDGLVINVETGIISGKLNIVGDYPVELVVTNTLGKANQKFTIKVGDLVGLTPPMGWNSWNCWGLDVSSGKMKKSAQALIDKGLINHGWNYINIDDGWEKPVRDAEGNIVPNDKFPDMETLGSWLHNRGLKFGIYSSPGTQTCGAYLGSYGHEVQDAQTYAKWGVDFLKYDWCSYESIVGEDTTLAAFQKPYQIMQNALKDQPRDIFYSLCQYGRKDVWKWGAAVNGNSWRTTGDIKDTWEHLTSMGFGHPEIYKYAAPGRWNDPDMFLVGRIGGWSGEFHNTYLTPDEQYTHVSLWCLRSAPLLIGCDLIDIDDFTLNLLTNDEVLAIDQDVLGKEAQQKIKTEDIQIWVKELEDGSQAIGLFNMSNVYQKISLKDLSLTRNFKIRDLWRQRDLGETKNGFTSDVPPHGVTLIKLIPQ